ncbi:MAG: ROK family protein [Actinomycetota bacterium]|nr:ROK family protein [Actinomycetota bacterium]
MALTAGVDLGGTKILAALVDDNHDVIAEQKVPTPADGPESVVEAIRTAVEALPERPDTVGIGAPGPVHDGVVKIAPNLPGWDRPVPLAEQLSKALGLQVVVDNDATVGALGEFVAGAGRGARNLLGVWIGTGVGGGLVLEGRAYRGSFGGAGEFGHMVVRQGGQRCNCGRRGCLEAYAGRASMERAVSTLVAAGAQTALTRIAAEKNKSQLTSSVWKRALSEGDPIANQLLDEAVSAVSIGVANAVNLLDLDRVVIGGGFAEALGQPLADRIAQAARPYFLVGDADRDVVVAELVDTAGVVGAAALARQS